MEAKSFALREVHFEHKRGPSPRSLCPSPARTHSAPELCARPPSSELAVRYLRLFANSRPRDFSIIGRVLGKIAPRPAGSDKRGATRHQIMRCMHRHMIKRWPPFKLRPAGQSEYGFIKFSRIQAY
jgi:hypothetical protein